MGSALPVEIGFIHSGRQCRTQVLSLKERASYTLADKHRSQHLLQVTLRKGHRSARDTSSRSFYFTSASSLLFHLFLPSLFDELSRATPPRNAFVMVYFTTLTGPTSIVADILFGQ